MKYIKKFNESKVQYNEILEICEEHLAYLKDKGFEVHLPIFMSQSAIHIELATGSPCYKWFDIKDDIIQLLIMLDDNYPKLLSQFKICFFGMEALSFDIIDIIENDIDIDYIASRITDRREGAKDSISYIEIPMNKIK